MNLYEIDAEILGCVDVETGEIFDEYTTDGGHLTSLGYEVLTEQITPAVQTQLALWKEENMS